MSADSAASADPPRPAPSDIDVFGLTDRGRVRKENQDQFLVASLHKLLRVHQSSIPADDLTQLVTESRGFLLSLPTVSAGGPTARRPHRHSRHRPLRHHFMDLYRRRTRTKRERFSPSWDEPSRRPTRSWWREAGARTAGGGGGRAL